VVNIRAFNSYSAYLAELKLKFIFLIATIVLLGGCLHRKESVLIKKYPVAKLKEDADVFRKVTLAMHPAIGIYEPRTYYVKLFDKFVDDLRDSLTEKQFRIRLKLLADHLHCGHTEVLYSNAYYREIKRLPANFSPYVFIPQGNRIFVLANLNRKRDSTLKKGTEILAINGIGADSMLRYSKRFISSDGFNQTARDYYIRLSFNAYMVSLFGRPDTFTVVYLKDNKRDTLRYTSFRSKSIPDLSLGPRDDSLFRRYRRSGIKYRYLDSEQTTMMMKVERFSPRGENKAYRRIFRRLQKSNSRNLILDLRNNGGGSLLNAYRLLTYLVDTVRTQTLRTCIRNYPYRKYTRGNLFFKFTRFAYSLIGKKRTTHDTDFFTYTIHPRTKNHFNGKLVVLINGGSFSASALVAAYLRDRHRAVFIGEETGGAQEGCNAGITPYYKLPNTKIRVRMPAFRVLNDVCTSVTGRGIIPEYKIEYSLQDIMLRRDPDLIKAKEVLGVR
jgi:hypothetical protein